MLVTNIDVINKLGLHARAAAKLVALASTFNSNISLKRNNREVNAKSIMGVMMLAATCGTQVEITLDGHDEKEALASIKELFHNRFDEGE
jgi:phosphocarrier protein HPr